MDGTSSVVFVPVMEQWTSSTASTRFLRVHGSFDKPGEGRRPCPSRCLVGGAPGVRDKWWSALTTLRSTFFWCMLDDPGLLYVTSPVHNIYGQGFQASLFSQPLYFSDNMVQVAFSCQNLQHALGRFAVSSGWDENQQICGRDYCQR